MFALLPAFRASAQFDTVNYHVGVWAGVSGQDYLPHWLTANRFGILDDGDRAVGLTRVGASSVYRPNKHWSFTMALDAVGKYNFAQYTSNLFLQQGYLQIKRGIFVFTGGRLEQTLGTHAEGLSSGSLAVSGNARPIPQLQLAVPGYRDVPFTKGFVSFKGTYTHGWLGNDKERNIKNSLLHEKSFYLKFGGKFPLNFSAGLIHQVVWGGEDRKIGKLPASLRDYARVIMGESAEAVDLNNPLLGEAANALGDNMGVYDFGLHLRLKDKSILVYHQTPFEDWTGSRLFRNKDRLLGIYFQNGKENKWLKGIVYEFLYTKYQSGPSRPGGANDAPGLKDSYGYDFGGRDNYYNNYLYKTGWVYLDRIIGTPLFYTKSRARRYIEGFVDPDEKRFNFNVVNNRVVAHHIGIEGGSALLKYKLLATFTKNFGTYGGINGGITEWGSIENPDAAYAFRPAKRQYYFLLEVETHPFSKQWSLLTSVGWDTGQLTRNAGLWVGLRRQGIIRRQPAVQGDK